MSTALRWTSLLAEPSTSNRSSPTGELAFAAALDPGLGADASNLSRSYSFKEAAEAFEANAKGVGRDGAGVIKIIIAGPQEADTA